MYDKYHEMDIHQFIDAVLEIQSLKHTESKLRRLRKYAAFSQSQLAERSGPYHTAIRARTKGY